MLTVTGLHSSSHQYTRMSDQNGNINPSKNIQKPNSNNQVVRRGRRRSSNSTLPCPTCGELYSRRDNLKVHQRVHSGEKPFKCDECGARFRWVGVLRTHQTTHQRQSKDEEQISRSAGSSPNRHSASSASRESLMEQDPGDSNRHTASSSQRGNSSRQIGPKDVSITISMLLSDENEEEIRDGQNR